MSESPAATLPMDPGEPTFPLRAASIDVGSNAMRFLAAEFADAAEWERLDYVRAPVRLGADAFSSGVLSDDLIDAAVRTMADFRQRMDRLGIEHYRAVATSAVRDSSNGELLVERVQSETGLRLDAISGAEEARLVWLAIHARLALAGERWLLVDLGGGSVEISLVDGAGVRWSESHLLGTVRLLESLRSDQRASPTTFRRILRDQAELLRLSDAIRDVGAAGLIATGGNVEAIADLANAEVGAHGARVLPLAALQDVLQRVSRLTPEQRVEELGLRPDRADVILPAAVVYERISQLVGASELLVPDVGLKEGVLLDLLDDVIAHGPHEARLDQEVLSSAVQLGHRYRFDEGHGRHVARLALSLFDQLRESHDLDVADRRMLMAAAVLHDIGQFVSYRRHHKHSQYLISNSEIAGLSPRETALASVVARYHRRAEPRDSHEEYGDLSEGDRDRVSQLAALLRVADALDREHRQQVSEVVVERLDGAVRLQIQGKGDLFAERRALQSKAGLFERLFEVELRA